MPTGLVLSIKARGVSVGAGEQVGKWESVRWETANERQSTRILATRNARLICRASSVPRVESQAEQRGEPVSGWESRKVAENRRTPIFDLRKWLVQRGRMG